MNDSLRKNPVFWLMWILPGAAVLAGFTTLAIALQGADRALPAIYHWEGDRLDADFERARVAARLGLRAQLELADGECRLTLHGADAPALELRLTSGSDTRLDRAPMLTRGADGLYRGACAPLPRGKWRVALADAGNTWSLRTQIEQADTRIELQARAPEGPAT